jgi:6-phosphogluconolactonase
MQVFQLQVCTDPATLVAQVVESWRQWSAEAIAARGSFRVALAGGSTPKQLYAQLAQTSGLDWEKTILAWGDERYVPSDHADSNYRMTRESLLAHIQIPARNLLPWPTAAGNPEQDAAQYAHSLQQALGSPVPVFDLVLLGVGGDGHTASLFPGTEALLVTESITAVGSKDGEPRLTLTYPIINASCRVMFLVAGSAKAEIMAELLTSAPQYPAQQVQPQGSLVWMLDQAAAAKLPLAIHL